MDSAYTVIFAALLPVLILLFYIYRRDKYAPEPVSQILQGVGFGVLSVIVTFILVFIIDGIGLDQITAPFVSSPVNTAFWSAAIPEEAAKLSMLYVFLRKNKHFDEHLDGIVYAVAVSMGFAAVENVLYLFQNYDNWLSVGITRALFSVPGHFAFAVFMGYFFSLYRFSFSEHRKLDLFLAWAVPMVLHGIYDSLLMSLSVVSFDLLAFIILAAFLVFCYYMHKFARRRIAEYANRAA